MADIVRDIVETQPAKTVTPDYQSPNGFGAILGGIAGAAGQLINGYGKRGRGGSGSDKDLASAYDYVRGFVNQLDSAPTSASEKQKIYDDVAVNAMRIFKVDENDIKNIYEMTGMNKYGDVPKAIRKLNLDMDTVQQENTLLVGASMAPNASVDTKMQLGATAMAMLSQSEVSIRGLRSMTPEQQQGVLEKGPIKTSLTNAIALMWADQYSRPEMQSIPEEAALMSFKDNMVDYLASQNVAPNIARAFVDNATLAQQVQIYGTEYLENKKGLEFLRDKAKKAYDVTNQIQEADMLNQFFDMKFTDVPLEIIGKDGTGTLTGRELYFLVGSNGSEASVSGLLKALGPAAAQKILPQLVKQTKDRWTWQQMKLVLSEQGATMASILSDNQEASKNIADGVLKANDEIIKDFNEQSPEKKKATNSYWLPAEQLIRAFTLPTGALQDPSVVDVGYDQKMKDSIKESFFRSVTAGTDSATVDPGFFGTSAGGFYQIADDGSVHYYGLSGQRIRNATVGIFNTALSSMTDLDVNPAVTLMDLTNAGKYVRGGDMDAVRMREGIPVVQRGLEMLEKSFGFDRKALIKEFNDYQIRNSIGGQKARSTQLLTKSGEWGAFTDRSQTMEMSDRDVRMVQEQIKGGLADAGKAADIAVQYPLEALEKASDFTVSGVMGLFGGDTVGWDVSTKQDGKDIKMRVTVDEDGFNVLSKNDPFSIKHISSKDVSEKAAKEMLLERYDISNPTFKALNVQTAAPKVQGATVTKTSTGYSLVLPDGTTRGNYKTPAEAFRAAATVKPVSKSYEMPANVAPFEYQGNIDLDNRPVVTNEDGSISTELSIVIEEDGQYIIIPTVVNGKVVSDDEAVKHYHETGENHGKYKSVTEAVRKSQEISREQAKRYLKD